MKDKSKVQEEHCATCFMCADWLHEDILFFPHGLFVDCLLETWILLLHNNMEQVVGETGYSVCTHIL